MAHFAKIENGIVTEVIVAEQDFIDNNSWQSHLSGLWIQTSYNTYGGKHYNSDGTESADQSKALRKNYASKGFTYDITRDAFIPPKPHASWTLNEATCLWEPPISYPSDGKYYLWNENNYQADNTTGWVLIEETI